MNNLKLVAITYFVLIGFITGCANSTSRPVDIQAINALYPSKNIITAGQPTENDITQLVQAGVSTVINMRTEGEYTAYDEKSVVEANRMSYIHIPVNGAKGMSKENAQKLDEAIAASKGRIFVHCGSGNRVGGLFAMRAFHIQGKSTDEAMAEGKKSGLTSLAPVVESQLK